MSFSDKELIEKEETILKALKSLIVKEAFIKYMIRLKRKLVKENKK